MDLEHGYDPRAFEAMPQDELRQSFVRKVYGTLAVQLALTAMIAAPIAVASDVWLSRNSHFMMLSLIGLLVFSVAGMCGGASSMFRKHPFNIFVLFGFTICESVVVGFTCAMYELQSVLSCLLATAAVFAGLTTFAFKTKSDFTRFGPYLRSAVLSLFVVGLVGVLFRYPLLHLLYLYASTLLSACYLVYDTQLIIGGKHQHCRYGVDDYTFAALSVYLDIVRLFVFILRIIGQRRSSRR